MPAARRTRFLFFYCQDHGFVDVPALLRGAVRPTSIRQLHAISILRGAEYPIGADALETLLSISALDWVEVEAGERLDEFADQGLVVLRDTDGPLAELRDRDEQLVAGRWNLYGALYHAMTRWRDLDIQLSGNEPDEALLAGVVDDFVRRHGPPPPHFHSLANGGTVHELAIPDAPEGLENALMSRRTTRSFDPAAPISATDLATILYFTYGCHGYARVHPEIVALRKTSPSGGGLHPIEAYALVLRAEGLDPGIYHYDAARHALEPLGELTRDEAVALADTFTCGQVYFHDAAVLFVLTARFARSFWKYRTHERAYAVVLMDAAHQSQTFYLVCAELGLGAFFTAAVNAAAIDERLGLDGFSEGALAISGCGHRGEGGGPLEPRFEPFVPRQTPLP